MQPLKTRRGEVLLGVAFHGWAEPCPHRRLCCEDRFRPEVLRQDCCFHRLRARGTCPAGARPPRPLQFLDEQATAERGHTSHPGCPELGAESTFTGIPPTSTCTCTRVCPRISRCRHAPCTDAQTAGQAPRSGSTCRHMCTRIQRCTHRPQTRPRRVCSVCAPIKIKPWSWRTSLAKDTGFLTKEAGPGPSCANSAVNSGPGSAGGGTCSCCACWSEQAETPPRTRKPTRLSRRCSAGTAAHALEA